LIYALNFHPTINREIDVAIMRQNVVHTHEDDVDSHGEVGMLRVHMYR
jgi:hypothetical protein